MSRIIGLAGQANNGKDSIADYLVNELNERCKEKWKRSSFASNVKRIFSETFGVSLEFIEKYKRSDKPAPGLEMSIREGLTFIGDGFRKIKPTIWMDLLLLNNKDALIISDGRYKNEIERIRKEGGINILIWRQGHENNIDNASEQEFMPYVKSYKNLPDGILENQPFDIWIKNDGSLEDLFKKVDSIIMPYALRKFSE